MKQLAFIISSIMLISAPVLSQHLFLFITDDGQPKALQLLSINDTNVDVVDPDKGHQALPIGDCLALVRPEPLTNVLSNPHIQLKDGQVFVGRPTPTTTPDVVLIQHPWLGALRIPLTHIESIQLNPPTNETPTRPVGFDQITLANGDALAGFISSISDPISIEVEQNGATELLQIPWGRISTIHLFGDPEPNVFPRVWLQDGTIVSLDGIVVDDDWLLGSNNHQFYIPDIPVSTPNQIAPSISDIHSIVFEDQSIHPLSMATNPTVTTPGVRITDPGPSRLDASAILGLSPLSVSGPTSITWAIPEGVNTFRTTVRLPISMWAWGNLDIQLFVNGKELRNVHIDKDSPDAYFFTPVEPGELTIKLHEGLNGPIQDTVVLEYPMFFNRTH
jgi:hypothetical protein